MTETCPASSGVNSHKNNTLAHGETIDTETSALLSMVKQYWEAKHNNIL